MKFFNPNADMNLDLLQITTTPLGPGIPCPTVLLLSGSIMGIMLVMSRSLVNADMDNDHYEALVAKQHEADNKYDMFREYDSVPIGSIVADQLDDWRQWTHGSIVDKGDSSHSD